MSDNVSPQIALGDTVTLHFSSADAQTGEMLEYTYDEEPKGVHHWCRRDQSGI